MVITTSHLVNITELQKPVRNICTLVQTKFRKVVKNGKKGTGTTLGDKTKTMNVVIKDLNETKLKYERENALLIQQLSNKKNKDNDDKDALARSAFKLLEEFNRKQNSTPNLKRKNNSEDDEVIETSNNNKVNKDIDKKKKKKSKTNKLLEEDEEDASVAYSNFTNETEYSEKQDLDDLDDDIVEVANVAKAAKMENNNRTSPRKHNLKHDSNHDKKNDVAKGKKSLTKNKDSNGKYHIIINVVDNDY
jgi:hypothetical protein